MVASVALAAGKEAFSDYSHRYSPKKFTQPQLFACLVLQAFEKKDYRGVRQLLLDCSDLRANQRGRESYAIVADTASVGAIKGEVDASF
jgi:hypothetical protein